MDMFGSTEDELYDVKDLVKTLGEEKEKWGRVVYFIYLNDNIYKKTSLAQFWPWVLRVTGLFAWVGKLLMKFPELLYFKYSIVLFDL